MVLNMLEFQFQEGSVCEETTSQNFTAKICQLLDGEIKPLENYLRNEMIAQSDIDDFEKILKFAENRHDAGYFLNDAFTAGLIESNTTTVTPPTTVISETTSGSVILKGLSW